MINCTTTQNVDVDIPKRIQFHIVAATSLPLMNYTRRTTYVTVHTPDLDRSCKTSKVKVQAQQTQPEWNENMPPMSLKASSTITFKVKHHSLWPGASRVVGTIQLPLANLLEMQGSENDTFIALPMTGVGKSRTSSNPTLTFRIRELASQQSAAEAAARAVAARLQKSP